MYSDDELLDALRELKDELGRTPTLSDIKNNEDMPSDATYYDRFGSYSQACEQAGLDPNTGRGGAPRARYDDEEIFSAIRSFAIDNGRVPRTADFDELDYLPSAQAIFRRFGGLAETYAAAIQNQKVSVEVDRYHDRAIHELEPGEEKTIRTEDLVVTVSWRNRSVSE